MRVAKNAVANLVRGGSAAVVSLFLPAVLVRHMSQADYSVWVLVLQVAAYTIYLEGGLQTAVGRYLAIAVEQNDPERGDSIYSTALFGLSLGSAAVIAILIGIACAAGWLFPSVPAESLPPMRWALLIAGSSIALGMPAYAFTGVFIGLQRNEFIALVSGGARLISGLGLAIAVVHGSSVVTMACVVAIINVASYLLFYILVKRFSPVAFHFHLVRKSTARELLSYCSSLVVWSFCMLLISGLDLILVGRFQFSALAPYAIATALVNVIAGIQGAIFGAAMPHAAVLHARRDFPAVGKLVVSYTRLSVLLLLLTGMPILIYARLILRIWVGQQYASQGHMLLYLLIVANIIRLVGLPYSVVLVASGQQRLVTLSPLLEGFTNLFASVLLGVRFGAAGVAVGTLIGGIIGMLGHVFYNMPRTRDEVLLRTGDFLVSGIGAPTVATIPLIALAVLGWNGATPLPIVFAGALGLSLLLSAALFLGAGRVDKRAT